MIPHNMSGVYTTKGGSTVGELTVGGAFIVSGTLTMGGAFIMSGTLTGTHYG